MLELTDQELRVLMVVLQKADPMQLINEIQSVFAKCNEMARERGRAMTDVPPQADDGGSST